MPPFSFGCFGSGRAADENVAHLLLRCSFVVTVYGGDFAGQTLKRGFIKLPPSIALLALVVGAVQVANNFCNRDQIA